MRVFEQEKLCHERAAQKQMLHNVRSKNAKKAFRKRMQGVSKRLVGELHHQQYSPYQFLRSNRRYIIMNIGTMFISMLLLFCLW